MSMTGTANRENEVSFGYNKYDEPELLNLRESVASVIVNALFMVPGNLPSMPTLGVNIKKYFYMEEDEISSDQIRSDLDKACGRLPGGAAIQNVDFSMQPSATKDGTYVFLLIVRLIFSNGDETLLGITMQDKKDIVKFNFDYIDI